MWETIYAVGFKEEHSKNNIKPKGILHFAPQGPSPALQNREDGLGGSSSAGYSSGKLHLRVRVFLQEHASVVICKVRMETFLSWPCRYVGELISDAEADVREDDSYLFDLDNKVSITIEVNGELEILIK